MTSNGSVVAAFKAGELDQRLAQRVWADAVDPARDHVDHRLKRLRKDIQLRYRRGPRRPMDEQMKGAIESLSQTIVDDIPGRKAELIRDIERLESLFRESGTADDGAWIDAVRAESGRNAAPSAE